MDANDQHGAFFFVSLLGTLGVSIPPYSVLSDYVRYMEKAKPLLQLRSSSQPKYCRRVIALDPDTGVRSRLKEYGEIGDKHG